MGIGEAVGCSECCLFSLTLPDCVGYGQFVGQGREGKGMAGYILCCDHARKPLERYHRLMSLYEELVPRRAGRAE